MDLCFMGSMEFAVPILEGLNREHDIKLVVTQPDKPVGRKRILTPTKVKEKAIELGIEVFQPTKIRKSYKEITDLDLDFIIVAQYGQMIPDVVLSHAKYQAINVHASLLPKYRGGSPMHRAIQNGEKETGISIMYMASKMDSGDILMQRQIPILETDNVGTIQQKLALIGRDCLLDVLKNIDSIIPKKQDISQVTYAYNIKPEEEIIDFNKTSRDIFNHVRGFNPWPLTYAVIDGLKLKFYQVEYSNENLGAQPGEIVKIDKSGIYIQTGKGVIILTEVQLQGKKRMKINDFMNGIGRKLLIVGKKFK